MAIDLVEQDAAPEVTHGLLRHARDPGFQVWMRGPTGVLKRVTVARNVSGGVLQLQGNQVVLLASAKKKGWRFAKSVLTPQEYEQLEKFGKECDDARVRYVTEPEFFVKRMHTAGAVTAQGDARRQKPEPKPTGLPPAEDGPPQQPGPVIERAYQATGQEPTLTEEPAREAPETDPEDVPLVVDEPPPSIKPKGRRNR